MDTAVGKQLSFVWKSVRRRVYQEEGARNKELGRAEAGAVVLLLREGEDPDIFVPGAAREGGFLYAGGRGKLPIYEYRCSRGHQYERTEGFDALSEHRCPSCSGRSSRLISLPAVIFKGSGFYSTDNRKSSFGGNGGSSPVSSGEAPSLDSSSESKAEAKTTD